ITWDDLRLVLDEELDRLPEKYRAPLLLCCLGGRTRDEAAEQLGWTLGALKMRLERGRQLLRTRLARRGLSVSAALLAMLLAQHATAGSVPAVLATTTINAALLFAIGKTSAALSARVVNLAGLALSTRTGKLKFVGAAGVLLPIIGRAVVWGTEPRTEHPSAQVTEQIASERKESPATSRFEDATEESGLAALLRQHHARFPGWEPSGATLLDIDGNGQLDLHLAGQSKCLAALGRNTGG